jgi:hypothetical protein
MKSKALIKKRIQRVDIEKHTIIIDPNVTIQLSNYNFMIFEHKIIVYDAVL